MAGQANQPFDIQWNDDDFVRALKRKVEKMKETTEGDVKAAAIYITNEAKNYAAVDTGHMKSNIVWKEGRDEKGYYVAIYCRAFYWKFVEFGTRFMSAQPFMRPAFVKGLQFLRNRVKGRR